MSASSTKPERRVAPIQQPDLASLHGFGQGAHFKYNDSGNAQYEWHRRKYKTFADGDSDIPETEPHTTQVARPKAANDEKILSPYDRLMFTTEVSIRYHNRRKSHYENVFKLMMLGVVVMAFGTLTASFGSRIWLLAGVAALGLGTLVWNTSHRAREHAVISNEYQLLSDQIRMTPYPNDDDIRTWRNTRLRIQAKEPPMFWAVANDCYFEAACAWGMRPRSRGLPPVWLRPFINWIRF